MNSYFDRSGDKTVILWDLVSTLNITVILACSEYHVLDHVLNHVFYIYLFRAHEKLCIVWVTILGM